MEILPWQAVDSSSKRALLVPECMSVPLNDSLLITGGGQRSGVALAKLEESQVSIKESLCSMLERRAAHCLVNVDETKIYALGGKQNNKPINSVEMFEPEEQAWKQVMSMKSYRQNFGAVAVSSESLRKILIYGNGSGVQSVRFGLSQGISPPKVNSSGFEIYDCA